MLIFNDYLYEQRAVALGLASDSGLILDLGALGNDGSRDGAMELNDNVIEFDGSKFSCFPENRESLFFGGDTVLRIKDIIHREDSLMLSYGAFLEPLNAFVRMIQGQSIVGQSISKSKKAQKTMRLIMRDVLFALLNDGNPFEIPKYIRGVTMCHATRSHIQFIYDELKTEYEWLQCILTSNSEHGDHIAILNLVVLFSSSEMIDFLMGEDYILNEQECDSLMKNLLAVSEMNLEPTIRFLWPSKVPESVKSNLIGSAVTLDSNVSYEITAKSVIFKFVAEDTPDVSIDDEMESLIEPANALPPLTPDAVSHQTNVEDENQLNQEHRALRAENTKGLMTEQNQMIDQQKDREFEKHVDGMLKLLAQ